MNVTRYIGRKGTRKEGSQLHREQGTKGTGYKGNKARRGHCSKGEHSGPEATLSVVYWFIS